jgi:hypothetical protein
MQPSATTRSPRADGSRSAGIAALLVLTALALWMLRDAVFHGRVLFERDVHSVWYTQIEVFVHTVASGAWPLWDPFVSFGHPMLANPNTQVLYPPTWLNLLIRPWTFYTLYAVAHLVFGAAGVYSWLRRLGASRGASLLAGAVWMLSGPVLSLVNVWHHLAGAAWMPWVLLAADRAIETARWRDALLWGIAAALQLLAGSPDACVETVLLQAAWLLGRFDYRQLLGITNRRRIAVSLLAVGFAALLAAAQWMPSLEAARHSERSELSYVERTSWSYAPAALPGLVMPVVPVGLPIVGSERLWAREMALPFLRSAYLGLPALVLVLLGLTRRGTARDLALIGVLLLLMALGRHTPVYETLATVLPFLKSVRFPEKFLVALAFVWASLAGLGFDAWRERRQPWPAAVVVALVSATALVGALVVWHDPERIARSILEVGAPAGVLVPVATRLGRAAACGALAVALVLWTRRHAITPTLLVAMAAAVVGDLAATHDGLNPTASREIFTIHPPVVDMLRQDAARRIYVWDYFSGAHGPSPVRWDILALQAYLRPPLAGRWGFAGSFDEDMLGLYPRPLTEMVHAFQSLQNPSDRLRLLQLGGVDHLIALQSEGVEGLTRVADVAGFVAKAVLVFRVPDPQPQAYLVARARTADDKDALQVLLDPAFDPRNEIVLPPGAATGSDPGPLRGAVNVVSSKADRVRLVAESDHPGWLVVLSTFDPGWHARVDGQSTRVMRANVSFQAIQIAAGHHEVELIYRPTSVILGLTLSGLALLVGFAVLITTRERA